MVATKLKGMDVDVSKLFDQAIEMYEASLKAGVKAQEDAAKFMTDAVDGMTKPVDFQAETEKFLSQVLPTAQKNFDEAVKLMNKNAEVCLDLMKKSFEVGQCKNVDEAQAKTRELWEASLKASKANTQAMIDANAKLLQSWADLAKKGTPAAASAK
jgi:hypothetical protein